MISLEVRRTLVKSPPELWAEVSDPVRLARHLSELGDITIVGTDPEQMVEWEAQDARGSVLMKPSGWGTKVTLTVLHETPEPAPPPACDAASEPQTPAAPGAPAGPEPTGALQASGEPGLYSSSEASSDPAPPAPQEAAAEPEPRASSAAPADPASPIVHETRIEPELLFASEASAEPEPPADPGAGDCEPELEPGRSFFARLFGRRRWKEAPQSDQPDSIEAAEWAPEATVAAAPDEAAGGVEDADPAIGPAPQGTATGPPATEAGTRPGYEEPPFPAIAALEGETDERTAQDRPTTGADQPAALAAGAPMRVTSPAQGPDISAELRTAEEVAAEHVKAVLTSMLDRLGAAHHRPFSRA